MEEESPDSIAASREESDTFHGGTVSREDYVHTEPQPGTSELCERLQRLVLINFPYFERPMTNLFSSSILGSTSSCHQQQYPRVMTNVIK